MTKRFGKSEAVIGHRGMQVTVDAITGVLPTSSGGSGNSSFVDAVSPIETSIVFDGGSRLPAADVVDGESRLIGTRILEGGRRV